jgi:hypothetical protein
VITPKEAQAIAARVKELRARDWPLTSVQLDLIRRALGPVEIRPTTERSPER